MNKNYKEDKVELSKIIDSKEEKKQLKTLTNLSPKYYEKRLQ